MNYLGDYAKDYATLNFKFTTRAATGVPTTLAGSPVVKVYKGSSLDTETTAGVTLAVDFDGVTGLNNVLIDLSADAFYAVANDYMVVITTGTVGGVSVVGEVVATFSIENRCQKANVVQISGDEAAADNLALAYAGRKKYWYKTGADAHWDTLAGNWWLDADHTVPALEIPQTGEYVYLLGATAPDTDPTVAVTLSGFDTTGLTDTLAATATETLTIQEGGTLIMGIPGGAGGAIHYWDGHTGVRGTFKFFDGADCDMHVGDYAEFYENASCTEVVGDHATFHGSSHANPTVVIGNYAIFLDASYVMPDAVAGTHARFYNRSVNLGTVGGYAVFRDNSYNAASGVTGKEPTFRDGASNRAGGSAGSAASGTTRFFDWAYNQGTVLGTVEYKQSVLASVFTGITSLAAWLRGLFRKSAMDATAKTEVNTGGGTYDEATDSQEGIEEKLVLCKELLEDIAVTGAAINRLAESVTVEADGGTPAGTLADTETLNDQYHSVVPDTGKINFYFDFDIGAQGVPVNVTWNGRLDKPAPAAETIDVYAWHWDAGHEDFLGTIAGIKNSTSADDSARTFTLFLVHVGTGANEGKVRIRFTKTGMDAADTFYTDQIFVSAAIVLGPQDMRDAMQLAPTAGAPAADSVDADLDILKAVLNGITSLAAWLRGLFRKDAMDAVAEAEVNLGGGAYDEAADSNEAIADELALMSPPGTGSVVKVYQVLVGGVPESGVLVEVFNNVGMVGAAVALGYTDMTGNVSLRLDPGTYYLRRYKAGIAFVNPDIEVVP